MRLSSAALLGLSATIGCNWISLAKNAYSYETTARGEAANVVARDGVAWVAVGEDGLAIVDARTGARLRTVAPPSGSESVDDVAIADSLLFVLDAREPGHLSAFALRGRDSVALLSPPRTVPVGPFSGVSASQGIAVVSGGTSRLTAWRYDASGLARDTVPFATADLGRGQPDVLLANGVAFVATHYWGPYFGLDVVPIRTGEPAATSKLELDGGGFTDGGAKPANFPIELALMNDTTLLVAFARGVAVIDVARPEQPRLVRVVDVGGPAVNVDAANGVAAVSVAGATPEVAILDSLGGVVRHRPLPAGTKPLGVALSGTNAEQVIVAARGRGVMIVNR